jgi:hypothetical protein
MPEQGYEEKLHPKARTCFITIGRRRVLVVKIEDPVSNGLASMFRRRHARRIRETIHWRGVA